MNYYLFIFNPIILKISPKYLDNVSYFQLILQYNSLIALPFSEIYLGIKYGDRISCSSKIINIPLKNWLILKGSITLLNIFSYEDIKINYKKNLFENVNQKINKDS